MAVLATTQAAAAMGGSERRLGVAVAERPSAPVVVASVVPVAVIAAS
jgi:hypothetical protein